MGYFFQVASIGLSNALSKYYSDLLALHKCSIIVHHKDIRLPEKDITIFNETISLPISTSPTARLLYSTLYYIIILFEFSAIMNSFISPFYSSSVAGSHSSV